VPHYWFRIPLTPTAPHLKEAKQRGGAPEIKKEIRKDAHSRRKSLKSVGFESNLEYCDAIIESDEPMSNEDCEWFRQRWDITNPDHAPCRPMLSADESVLADPNWIRGGPSGDEAS
jgi:hypothetical protein